MRLQLTSAKTFIHRLAAYLVAFILRLGAVYDPANFKIWEKQGYHITPLHFYEPIPDTRELEQLDLAPSMLAGINLREDYQLHLLREVFPTFRQEYNALPLKSSNPQTFALNNDAFSGIDPLVYYSIIRHFKPKKIVEIGSGFSTLLGAQTLSENNNQAKLIVVDPWPRDFIAVGVKEVELIRQKIEKLDAGFIEQLEENDIFFVDSSHVIRTAGDVCFLILDVLPRLKKGVIVHFHDIFLPFDYPKEWLLQKHRFWTEQYLLQAYLAENNSTEVLFSNHYMINQFPEEVNKAFPKANKLEGASFWFRKC